MTFSLSESCSMKRFGGLLVAVWMMGCPAPTGDATCPSGTPTRCGDACVEVMTSRSDCGACGNSCGDAEVCLDGACKVFCPEGLTEVNATCVNLAHDVRHCGSVNHACDPGQVCSEGTCAASCAAGLTACQSACADMQRDALNCGSCGNACAENEACIAGSCRSACEGFPTTDGKPVLSLSLLTPDDQEFRLHYSYILQQSLREIGIQLTVRSEPFGEVLGTFFGTRGTGLAGFDLGAIGNSSNSSGGSPLFECGSAYNYMNWCDSTYNAASEEYASSLNPTVRTAAVRRMNERFVDQIPALILYTSETVQAMSSALEGVGHPFSYRAARVWSGMTDVTMAVHHDFESFNPLFSDLTADDAVHSAVFQSLVIDSNMDLEDPTKVGLPVPDLAHELPIMVAGQGTEHSMTINLKASSFSDGHPVDAYDVLFSYLLYMDPRVEAPRASMIAEHGIGHDAMTVVDADTVRITFPTVAPEFLGSGEFMILPMHYWVPHADSAEAAEKLAALMDSQGQYTGPIPARGDAFDTGVDLIGSGPYKAAPTGLYDSATKTVRLVRNTLSSTPVRSVEKFQIRVMSKESAVAGLQTGAVNLIVGYDMREKDVAGTPGVKSVTVQDYGFQIVGFNLDNPLLQQADVRRAIHLAVPRERIVDEAAGGLGTPASAYLSPANPWYDPDFGPGGAFGPRLDLQAARVLMRQAGYTSVSDTAPTLRSKQAMLCNTAEALDAAVADGHITEPVADRILSDLARSPVGR